MYKCSREKGERAPGRAGSGAHRWCPALFPALGLGVLSTACPALPPRAPVQFIPAQLLAKFLWSHSDSPKGLMSMSPFWPRTPESHHEQTITHPLMDSHGQKHWFFQKEISLLLVVKHCCTFFFLFNFIHELKWLWAVTNQFFTVFWTDGCSKNTSILAVSNSLDLPKQRCRLFIRRKEVKNHSHSPNFFLDY